MLAGWFSWMMAMPNYRRALTPGGTWLFTVKLLERRGNELLVRHIDLLRACVATERLRHAPSFRDPGVGGVAGAHALDVDTAGRRWGLSNPLAAHQDGYLAGARTDRTAIGGAVNQGKPGIWQRFCDHQLRFDIDHGRHLHYIYYNLVKHGCANSAALWPHSSFAEIVRVI